MDYPGYLVKEFRESLDRPIWKNCNRDPKIHPFPSARDMCAMINYCLHKRGIQKKLPLRTYHGWEIGRYPLWFRTAMFWICDDIRHIVSASHKFEFVNGTSPTVRRCIPIEERISAVNVDPDCCKR